MAAGEGVINTRQLSSTQIAARLAAFGLTITDAKFIITGSSDATKTLKFECDAQTAGADLTIDSGAQTVDRTISLPVLTGNRTLAVIDQAQTYTAALTFSSTLAINGDATIGDGINVVLNTTTGTKIGTATGQKLGLWNVTPVIQPAAAGQAAAAAQTQQALTDSTGGSASTTLAAMAASVTGVDGTGSNAASKADVDAQLVVIRNAIASLAARHAETKADVTAIKTLQDAQRAAEIAVGIMKGSA